MEQRKRLPESSEFSDPLSERMLLFRIQWIKDIFKGISRDRKLLRERDCK